MVVCCIRSVVGAIFIEQFRKTFLKYFHFSEKLFVNNLLYFETANRIQKMAPFQEAKQISKFRIHNVDVYYSYITSRDQSDLFCTGCAHTMYTQLTLRTHL